MSRILGYADRFSVAPGGCIKVMVSCDGPENFDADVIRVIQGDTNPDGPGYKEERIALDLGGPFPGRYQPIHAGSYGIVADSPVFNGLSSITVQAFVWPTLPGKGPQTILSREDLRLGKGFRLFLDDSGALAFELSVPDKESVRVSTGKPCSQRSGT